MKFKVPYLQWREGRPRWEPGPKLRELGLNGRDLKTESGAWLLLPEAIIAAQKLNLEVTQRRATIASGIRRRAPPRKVIRSCRALYEKWVATPEFRKLAASTQADYRVKIEIFLDASIDEESHDTFGDAPVASIGRAALKGYWRIAHEERGHAMANGIMACVRAMLTFATDLEWIAVNPAFMLKLPTLPPRQVLWLPDEISAIVGMADTLNMASIGDAVIIALHSGQRQADVLAMPRRLFAGIRIRLSQLKMRSRGGALIDAPMTPALQARLAAIIARRQSAVPETLVELDGPLVRRDDNGEPYKADYFRKCFAEVRAAAAELMDGEDARHPAIAGKTFQDLRDTAVTRLALAECTLPQIAAITGHTQTSITDIIKHYLVLQPAMADTAIGKLSAWLEREGIEL